MARIPENSRGFAREAMLWLSFAFRPLRLTELCETVAFNELDATVDPLDRLLDAHDLLRWCQGLITYDPWTKDITLSHSSVRTYLLSDQIKCGPSSFFSVEEVQAERLLLRKCLTYMTFTDFGKGYRPNYHEWEALSRNWPLLSYASNHWASHAHALDAALEPYDHDLISRFCKTSNDERGGNFGFWIQCLSPRAGIHIARVTPPLYYAASFGLRTVVGSLIYANKGMNLDAVGGRNDSTALQVACYRGHYGVAKDLLHAGANPYHRDRHGRSSLVYALRHGDKDMAELLRQYLASRTDPKGETASMHIEDASTTADAFEGCARVRRERDLCESPDQTYSIR